MVEPTSDEIEDAAAEAVVCLLEQQPERDAALWPKMVEAGLTSMPLPARYGGRALGATGIFAMLTELATDAVEAPALVTLGWGVVPLLTCAPESLAASVFPAVARGAVLTAALHEPGAAWPEAPRATVRPHRRALCVSGTKLTVPYADRAQWLLVPVESGIAVVDPGATGVARIRNPKQSGAPEYSVELHDVEIPADQLLPMDPGYLYDAAVAALCAVADGLLRGMSAVVAEHVRICSGGRPTKTELRKLDELTNISRTVRAAAADAREPWSEDAGARNRLTHPALYVATELPTALALCRELHGEVATSPGSALSRYYEQASDVTRWLAAEGAADVLAPSEPQFASTAATAGDEESA